jgi:single-strand DNA-binding protein
MNINRVILTGNLTRDPELRSTPSGTSICELGLAVNEREKVAEEWRDRVNFFNVVVWGAQAENAARYLSKGSRIAVDGRLRYESWETDGQKRSTVKVVAQAIEYLHSKPEKAEAGTAGAGETTEPGDDIPF